MALTDQQVKEANARRVAENNYQKAVKQTAVEEAQESAALLAFSRRHAPGTMAAKNSPYYKCEANDILLIAEAREISTGGVLDNFSLEQALHSLNERGALAQARATEYIRSTDTQQSRVAPQRKTYAPPPLRLPYSKAEILSWPKERLRAEMQRGQNHVDAINEILASRQ